MYINTKQNLKNKKSKKQREYSKSILALHKYIDSDVSILEQLYVFKNKQLCYE